MTTSNEAKAYKTNTRSSTAKRAYSVYELRKLVYLVEVLELSQKQASEKMNGRPLYGTLKKIGSMKASGEWDEVLEYVVLNDWAPIPEGARGRPRKADKTPNPRLPLPQSQKTAAPTTKKPVAPTQVTHQPPATPPSVSQRKLGYEAASFVMGFIAGASFGIAVCLATLVF